MCGEIWNVSEPIESHVVDVFRTYFQMSPARTVNLWTITFLNGVPTIRIKDARPPKSCKLLVKDGTYASILSISNNPFSSVVSPFTNEKNCVARIAWICDSMLPS